MRTTFGDFYKACALHPRILINTYIMRNIVRAFLVNTHLTNHFITKTINTAAFIFFMLFAQDIM